MEALRIRPAEPADLEGITRIYNHYVVHTPYTFDLEPFTPKARRPWFDRFVAGGRHQLFVAEQSGRLLGYAGSMPFRAKAAYRPTVETTVYVDPGAQGQGVGRRLYGTLFQALEGADVHRALAGITLPNDGSVALHRRFGFEPVGVMREVGRKLGRYWDVAWMERPF